MDRILIGALLFLVMVLLGIRAARAAEIVPSVGLSRSTSGDGNAKAFAGLAVRGSIVPMVKSEIGVASAMTAAFIAQVMDSSPQVIENAAESALEHHLGMTCDPVAGYVQVPCIERCAFGAVKAWTAFMIATNEIASRHRVDLDTTIKTLAETGRDMSTKYKETSEAGLAANLVLC